MNDKLEWCIKTVDLLHDEELKFEYEYSV